MIIKPSRERGITFIGFLLLVGLVGFFLLLILKIGPIYLDHYKVVSTLESLKSDRDIASRTRDEIIRTLEKRWDINMVDSVSKDNVTIKKDPNQIRVEITYDVVKPILGNVDIVVHFDDAIEVSSN